MDISSYSTHRTSMDDLHSQDRDDKLERELSAELGAR